jgi:hypothetical protein
VRRDRTRVRTLTRAQSDILELISRGVNSNVRGVRARQRAIRGMHPPQVAQFVRVSHAARAHACVAHRLLSNQRQRVTELINLRRSRR